MKPKPSIGETMRAPLLRGSAHLQAGVALRELSAQYRGLAPARVRNPSLWSGLAGLALVHVALERVAPGAGHRGLAEQALGRAIMRLGRVPVGTGLSGIAGIGWLVGHLVGSVEGDADPCATFDVALAGELDEGPWTRSFDLIDGLAGIGVYALERLPRESGRQLLAKVVRHLGAMASPRRPGIAWRSDPLWVPPGNRKQWLDWNLGTAHGVPGVVALLGRIAGADVEDATRREARRLLEGAVAWLLGCELAPGSAACFPSCADCTPSDSSRLAWCYGDPGIAAGLLVAARAAKEPAWEEAALRIARHAALRAEASAGVLDAGLCHGAAGVAHIFHRIYRTTAEESFADASRLWFARALAMRDPGQRGFAGFRTHGLDVKRRARWTADPGFLTGAGGIVLALVAATTGVEPEWDRLLLVS